MHIKLREHSSVRAASVTGEEARRSFVAGSNGSGGGRTRGGWLAVWAVVEKSAAVGRLKEAPG